MKKSTPIDGVIVNLDHQVAQLRLDVNEKGVQLLGIDLTPDATKALKEIYDSECKIALHVPADLSREASRQLKKLVPHTRVVVPRGKDCLKAIERCCNALKTSPKRTVFVAADRVVRALAVEQKLLALPHLTLAAWAAAGHTLQFVVIRGPRSAFDSLLYTLPYALERHDSSTWSLTGVATERDISRASAVGLSVKSLDLNLSLEEPVLVHLDEVSKDDIKKIDKRCVLSSCDRRMLIVRGRSTTADKIEIHGRHGHNQLLTPQPHALRRHPRSEHFVNIDELQLSKWPLTKYEIELRDRDFRIWPYLNVCPTGSQVQADVDRYSGAADIDTVGPIASRHSHHPDNTRTVDALIADLAAMGYCPYTHSFEYDGLTLNNVIADLPGSGYFIIDPDILDRLRRVFIKYPIPWPPDPWMRSLEKLVGRKWLKEFSSAYSDPLTLRYQLEQVFGLRPYYPWWWLRCPVAGYGAQMIIAGCHLDSTAGFDSGYDRTSDPAPGADDDASGLAGVLAVARRLAELKGKLRNTVRFCFFNAEESGLVGSKAYAAWMKSCNAPIKAVVCMDMVGYNSDEERTFEVHAGYYDNGVRDASVPIAEAVADWAATLGALEPAQIYKGTSTLGAPDRDVYDGAINRSDHAAFHQQGYPAVVVTEDFFANLATEPGADPNPNYHRSSDLTIDSEYAADIVCAVTYAIKGLAA